MSALQHTCPCDSRKRRWRHSLSQQRLLWVRALLPAAGLLEGGSRRIAWVLGLLALEEICNSQELHTGKALVREVLCALYLHNGVFTAPAIC
jgi:hypothetical protein